MKITKSIRFFFTVLFLLLISAFAAIGQNAKEQAKQNPEKAAPVEQAPVEKKDVKLFIDKIEIEGRLEKPQVMLFLPGQTPEIDDIQIERSFMKNIFRPVENRVTVETKYRADYTKNQKSVIEW